MGDVEDYWPLVDIVGILKTDYDIEVTENQLKEWASRESTNFPEPKEVGRYKLYDIKEVAEWIFLWRRATARLGNGDRINGKR